MYHLDLELLIGLALPDLGKIEHKGVGEWVVTSNMHAKHPNKSYMARSLHEALCVLMRHQTAHLRAETREKQYASNVQA